MELLSALEGWVERGVPPSQAKLVAYTRSATGEPVLPQGRIGLVPFEMKAGTEDEPQNRQYIDTTVDLFTERTGQTRETVLRDLSYGRELDPEGAMAYGLIDSVVKR